MKDTQILLCIGLALIAALIYWLFSRTSLQMSVMKKMSDNVAPTVVDAVSLADPSARMLTLVVCSEGERMLLNDRGIRTVILKIANEHPLSAAILLYVFAFSAITSRETYLLMSNDKELLRYCSHANALVELVMKSNLSAQNKELAIALMAKSLPPDAKERAEAIYQEVFNRR